jgi:oxygen-independent coproporphyrinogen-3 oxidase
VKPLAVYVHIPFCTVKCGYCDFNAYAGMHNLAGRYAAALVAEVDSWAGVLAGRHISSVFFGGGTPSEVPAAHIARVLESLARRAPLLPGAEVSLEANPGTVSLEQLCGLRLAGVTRLSLGAQSFDPAELAFLDRIHSPEASAAAVRLAREAGFESVSLDLIFGLPGQTPAQWERSLQQAIALAPDHVSIYALTVEEGTPLERRVRSGEVAPLDPDTVAEQYELATDVLARAGFEQYEISNWARPGHQSQHNRAYWTDREYLGVGAGAHGYLGGERYENAAHPRAYIEAVNRGGSAVARREPRDTLVEMGDWLSLRLRLLEGFGSREFEARFGTPLTSVVGEALDRCRAAGLMESSEPIRLTRAGRLLHGEVAAELLAAAGRSTARPASRAPA